MNDEILERVPPQNLDAERALLGSVLLGGQPALDKATAIIESEDFYRECHKVVFDAAKSVLGRKEPIDGVTITEELQRINMFTKVGGFPYLAALGNSVPTATNVEYYAQIVKRKSLARQKIQECSETTTALYNDEDPIETISKSMLKDQAIISSVKKNNLIRIGEAVKNYYFKLDENKSSNGITGISTGYRRLDSIIGGLQSPSYTILAAPTSCGKTTLALNIARHVGLNLKIPVLIFSQEMKEKQLANKYLSMFSRVNNKMFHNVANIDSEGWKNLADGVAKADDALIFIDDDSFLKASEMWVRARAYQAMIKAMGYPGFGLIISDYIQKMRYEQDKMSDYQGVSEISRLLFAMCYELEVPTIAVSQLKRGIEQRDNKIPTLADLRESGRLEQDADQVWFLYRKDYYNEDYSAPDPSPTDLIVAKNRLAGGRGALKLNYYKTVQTFCEV